MNLLKLENAIDRCLKEISVRGTITIPLGTASGYVIAENLSARRESPPFDLSAMDGYAFKHGPHINENQKLSVIGKSPAGTIFERKVKKEEAVKVYTGSVMPSGTDTVIIQENTETNAGDVILKKIPQKNENIRKKGFDFKSDDILIRKGTKLTPKHMSLAASMNHTTLVVYRKPKIAIISNGDELVEPGSKDAQNKIISANNYGIKAYLEQLGANVTDFGIAKDNIKSLRAKIKKAANHDIIVTIGGASVGDFDLVKESIHGELELKFWKIAMRPGKPLIYGRLGEAHFLGLPGNPVSAHVCCQLFLKPMINKFMNFEDENFYITEAKLKTSLKENDERQDFIRGFYKDGFVTPHKVQDSSSLSVLNSSNVFIIREPNAPSKKMGEIVQILKIDF